MKNFIIFCVNFGKFYRFFHKLIFKEFKRGEWGRSPFVWSKLFIFYSFMKHLQRKLKTTSTLEIVLSLERERERERPGAMATQWPLSTKHKREHKRNLKKAQKRPGVLATQWPLSTKHRWVAREVFSTITLPALNSLRFKTARHKFRLSSANTRVFFLIGFFNRV